MRFEYTTDAGTRRSGGFDDISNGQGYQSTTLLNAERSTQFTVTAGESRTETFDGWSNGEATVYIVETLDGELFYANGGHCDGGDHTFFLRFRAYGSILSSSQCL
ncbi:hypothetical protein [Halomarina rubra]|uniref:Uncharacterized protein n=1 Tax=Halomarina rubra TaxID=2071873 RepID=A0ABD6B0D8_9EURY|nr:hypothetical protein [Halomarina rubra]